ncbi:hypothetical protein LTR62_000260 [Meristemomyces frigidus]|uniref:RING-type domain-containing protein n=1 Tax=Meristemomyces frigidus TaxID=1508187 RepID=A0AAN7TZ99_9PEZI|nr:hypothetical protein LTR62_000260 [Meristemomyces frigidus]
MATARSAREPTLHEDWDAPRQPNYTYDEFDSDTFLHGRDTPGSTGDSYHERSQSEQDFDSLPTPSTVGQVAEELPSSDGRRPEEEDAPAWPALYSQMGNESSTTGAALRPSYISPHNYDFIDEPRQHRQEQHSSNNDPHWRFSPSRTFEPGEEGEGEEDSFQTHETADSEDENMEVSSSSRGRTRESGSVVDLTAEPGSPPATASGHGLRRRIGTTRAAQEAARSREMRLSALASGSHNPPPTETVRPSSFHASETLEPSTAQPSNARAVRSSEQNQEQERPSKRRRTDLTLTPEPDSTVETLDLTLSPRSAALAAEQSRAIAAQQTSTNTTHPLKIGRLTCIICMEAYTNATVTPCGHIYCHECLDQALKQGERNNDNRIGTCPNCRQNVSRRRKGTGPIALAFMKKSAFKKKGRQNFEAFG